MILDFDDSGLLKPGTYTIDLDKFLSSFCRHDGPVDGDKIPRSHFHMPFRNIYDWAEEMGATSIVIGGSFISDKPHPNDIDILIFFARSDLIPKSSEVHDVNGVKLDIQMLSEDQPSIKAAFLELLSITRRGIKHGLVQIKFHINAITQKAPDEQSKDFEIVKAAYIGRHIQLQAAKGVIVPIHGIRTHADWMPHLSLLASASGWAVAPYVYGYRSALILRDEPEKQKIIGGFRDWLSTVKDNFDGPISIIAHSFGSYIIGRYLIEASDLSTEFDAIILCGSILNKNYDWERHLADAKVGKVLNVISEKDEWVKFLPEGGVKYIAKDKLFGKAGCEGFNYQGERMTQIKSSLLTHNNIIKTDIINGQWLPFLKLAHGSQRRSLYEKLRLDMLAKQANPQQEATTSLTARSLLIR